MASKLAWQQLTLDNNNLPESIISALGMFFEAKEALEQAVRDAKPAPKGRKWVFTYKYGVAIAHADAGTVNSANYF